MNVTERGIYRELLDECWIEGSIPADYNDLAEIARCTRVEIAAAWPALASSFSERPDGRFVNDKITRVLAAQTEAYQRQVEAGRRGGLERVARLKGASRVPQVASSNRVEEKLLYTAGAVSNGLPPVQKRNSVLQDKYGQPIPEQPEGDPRTPEQEAEYRALVASLRSAGVGRGA